jgi:hypothetical protein
MKYAVALAWLCAFVLPGCGGSSSRTSSTRAAAAVRPATTAPAPARARRRHAHRPDPGALPQTRQLPSSHTAAFAAEMHALWRAIRRDSPGLARPAFFPERAYAQVKAIADPAADYRDRLLAEYGLDIGAAHALLGAGAAGARLLRVDVPRQYAHWVDPGACFNRVGYFEVPNARLVYAERGSVRSLGIASMISWRGVWYVVHLGAVTRSGPGGTVDDPSSGPGVSAPSSTC